MFLLSRMEQVPQAEVAQKTVDGNPTHTPVHWQSCEHFFGDTETAAGQAAKSRRLLIYRMVCSSRRRTCDTETGGDHPGDPEDY